MAQDPQRRWQRRLEQELCRRQALRDPAVFRRLIRLPGCEVGPADWLPFQQADFAALDPAWQALATGVRSAGPRRAYLERPRGHSKTTDTAVQIAWILLAARRAVRGLAAAADEEQATLLHTAVGDLIRLNPQACSPLQVQQRSIRHRQTGSEFRVLSSDVNSSYGQLPDFVICDELCHWEQPELWYSLVSSAAKKPDCVLVVLTNAGSGSGWHWQVRETARTEAGWYFCSLTGPQVPWITADVLAEQRRLLPPPVYARLWENRWQHSDGAFVSLPEARACEDAECRPQSLGRGGVEYFAAVDYAEKHDRTVGVVLHRDGELLIVDRMDVVAPTTTAPTPVRWVEEWIAAVQRQFPNPRFVVDEYQLLGVIQKLQGSLAIERFDFAGTRGHHALAMTLRHLILHRRLRWWPGCGAIDASAASTVPRPADWWVSAEVTARASGVRFEGRATGDTAQAVEDDLTTELAGLVLRQVSGGRLRIDHRREPGAHDDRAFALGAACLAALRTTGDGGLAIATPPTDAGDFAWSQAAW